MTSYKIDVKTEAQIQEMVGDFIFKHPEITDGAVLSKIVARGSQGKRRISDIKAQFGGEDISTQLSVGKSDIQWISTQALSFKSTVASQVQALMNRIAIPYADVWIIPVSRLADYYNGANEIAAVFEKGVRNAIDNFDHYIEMEKNRSPKVACLIDQAKMTQSEFSKSFCFRIEHMVPFAPLSLDGEAAGDSYVDELLDSISAESEEIYTSISGKARISSSTITRLSNLKDKIISFSFLAPDSAKITDAFQTVIKLLPAKAIKDDRDIAILSQWLLIMSDPTKLERMMKGDKLLDEMLLKIESQFSLGVCGKTVVLSDFDLNDPFSSSPGNEPSDKESEPPVEETILQEPLIEATDFDQSGW